MQGNKAAAHSVAVFNPGTVVAVLGAALGVLCLGLLFSPNLRRVEDRAWLNSLSL